MNFIFRNKKILSYFLIIPIIISLSFSSVAVSSIYAQTVEAVIPVPTNDINNNAKSVGFTIMGHSIMGFDWNSIYILAMKTLLAHITDSIIEWINNGFEGGPAFVTDPQKFLLGVGDEVLGEFINEFTSFGWICDPFKLNIKIALSLGTGSFKRQRKCTLTAIIHNIDDFYNGTFKEGGWQGWFEISTNPNANPMSVYLSTEAELQKRIQQRNDAEVKKWDWGRGFLSFQECLERDPNNEKKCLKPGPIKTPGSVIVDQFNFAAESPYRQMELADDIDKIVGALTMQLVKTILTKGLSALSSNQGWKGTASDFEGSETKLMATCQADKASASTGEDVEWMSYVAGGPSDIAPVYKWTGDGITDSFENNNTTDGKSLKIRYSAIGNKTATLTAKKGNLSVTVQCPSLTITAKDTLAGSCSANQPEVRKGGNILWTWMPYVWSNELYSTATYEWSGDGLGNAYKSNPINVSYANTGEKSAGVVVTTERKETICVNETSCTVQTTYKHDLYNCGTINVKEEAIPKDTYSCSANKTDSLVGESVVWSVKSASGVDPTSYSWSGTDGLFGDTKTIETTYTKTGTKMAKVNVVKDGVSSAINCDNSVKVSNSKPFAFCNVNPATGSVKDGTVFTWTATAGGGMGNYKYKWSGTDSLTGNTQAITTTYPKAGKKSGQITVTSGEESVNATCDNTATVLSE